MTATAFLIFLLAVALVVSLLVNWGLRFTVDKLSQRNERLERSIDGLNVALLAKSQEVKRLERESVPIVQVPTNEEINRGMWR